MNLNDIEIVNVIFDKPFKTFMPTEVRSTRQQLIRQAAFTVFQTVTISNLLKRGCKRLILNVENYNADLPHSLTTFSVFSLLRYLLTCSINMSVSSPHQLGFTCFCLMATVSSVSVQFSVSSISREMVLKVEVSLKSLVIVFQPGFS